MRQPTVRENDPRRGASVTTLAQDYAAGFQVTLHSHGSDQLIYASCGVMEVASGQQLWMIPPHFGLWIPARTPHHIRMPARVSLRTIYLRPALTTLRPECTVLHVVPLLREIIFEVVRVGELRNRHGTECALRDLLVAELERAAPVPMGVVLPKDRRALLVAQAVIADPALRMPMKAMCATAGISLRTLERVFRREAGSDFESWRRRVRLMKAAELLVSGHSVKEVAGAIGYQHPGAFVTLFRGTFGLSPKAWISGLERLE